MTFKQILKMCHIYIYIYVCVLVCKIRTINAKWTAKRSCIFISGIHRSVEMKFFVETLHKKFVISRVAVFVGLLPELQFSSRSFH